MSGQAFTYSLPSLVFATTQGGIQTSTLNGTVHDLKSSLSVKIRSSLTSSSTSVNKISSARVFVDKWTATTRHSTRGSFSKDITHEFNANRVNANFTIGATTNSSVCVPAFADVSGNMPYNVLFQVTVQNTTYDDNRNPLNVSYTMYQSTYKFDYYVNPPTLSDFTFNTNIASGDLIKVQGLILSGQLPSDLPSKIQFQFNPLELISGDINDEFNEQYIPLVDYDASGNYNIPSNPLQNDNFYLITAIAYWSSGYSTYINSTSDLFVIARPSINNIQAYDAQNDEGNDGVVRTGPDVDTSDQVIATIVLNPLLYVNYLPDLLQFLFYDMSNNLIGTSDQTANLYDTNNSMVLTYNITLDSVSLTNNNVPLLNGMPGYSVYAQVNVPVTIDNVSYPDQERTSDRMLCVFRQGIAPILPLIIGNTWDLVSNGNPSSNPTLYNASPLVGISGYFLKNGQFMSGYARNLDTTATKFLLQYTLNGGQNNVVRAALVQQSSSETKEQAMIRAMGSVVNSANGQYTNVVGPSGTSGPSQNPLVFYIPNVQDSVTFIETNVVNVSVTVIDTSNQWLDPSNNVTNTSSSVSAANNLTLVNQIPTYSYTSAQKGQTVEPFIDDVYSNSNVMKAISNNQLIQVNKAKVIADSATTINQTANGWIFVNPDAVMSGNPLKLRYPKVNLYYYRNPNYLARSSSVAPWTPANKQQNATNSFTMSQINQSSSLGMWYVIYQNQGARLYPFLIAYTCPTDPADTPSSVNKAYWYKSNILYGPDPSKDATQVGLTLLYTGTDNGALYPEIPSARRVKLFLSDVYSNKNTDVSNELVSMVSVQTSSDVTTVNKGDFNFILRNTGIVTNSLLMCNYQFNFNDSSLMMIDNKLWLINDDDKIIADSANIITKSNKGWTVVNPDAVLSGNHPTLKYPKVNFYYYNMSATNSFTMSQINQSSSLGMWYVINQNYGAQLYPFLIAYTKPTGSGDAPEGWYKSNLLYGPDPSSDPTQTGLTLLYTGNDDGSLYPEIPPGKRVKLLLNPTYSIPNPINPGIGNETVMSLTVQTSSDFATVNKGDFNFNLIYAGVVTSGTSFSNINTFFANPLLKLNIPLNNGNSMYFNDATIVSTNTPTVNVVVKNVASEPCDQNVAEQPLSPAVAGWCLGMPMLPLLTENKYTVQYSIQNPNNSNAVVKGLVSNTSVISTLNEPQLTDFTVSNFSYNTFNNDQKSSIEFDLSLNPYVLDRIDGVHVYFTSDSNSSIGLTHIGTFRANQTGREIFLLSDASSNLLGSGSNPHSYNDPLVSSQLLWNPYTSATITFVPFRDNRVNSDVTETENLFGTFTAPTVWNIPVIQKPSASGTIKLDGGIVCHHERGDTVLNWVKDTGSAYTYTPSFSYTLTMQKDSVVPATSVTLFTDAIDASGDHIASAIIPIAATTTNTYTLTLQKVFEGQSSLADIIVFNSAKVETSGMVVSVLNPSNTSSVKVSWVAPVITGTNSSFSNNVASLYLTNNGVAMRSNVAPNTIEVVNGSYSISQSMGYTYQLQMSLTAQVPYTVNGVASSTKSLPVPLDLGPIALYTVSTIPNVSLAPYTALGGDSATVLINNTNTPSLLLNLNAKGLEVEGFISLVVVLTQDGTPSKPEGCEVLLQFPNAPTSTYLNDPSYNNLNQFLFPNVVGSAGSGNNNLVGGEPSSVVPLNLEPTGLSNNAGQYTLTIGSVILPSPQDPQPANVGRYGYSSLTFPANSGFVNGEASNIMAILSTRRGTDVMVGTFTFAAPPVASNVTVTSSGPGQYVLHFDLN